MLQASATAAKTITNLTCWKCGEETLKEISGATESFSSKGEKVTSLGSLHSDCQKCGAYSVNADQAQHNKIIARQNRKAVIKEANRNAS
jgi:ribosomal protein L44E